jgi:hypothetical protein
MTDRSNLHGSAVSGATARENSQVPKTETRLELKAWEEARLSAMRKHLVQVEQDQPSRQEDNEDGE